ncbi:MAG: hypothetical protein K0B10_08185 [Vicingaceae bacterium]|nr:hypothetical protein [Vicingaceae bacterium]
MKKIIIYSTLLVIILVGVFYFTKKDTLINDVIFQEYLEELNLSISKEKTNYILVPKVGCQGAMASVLMELDSVLNITSCKFIFITSNNELVSQYISSNKEIIIDENKKLDILNLPISNVAVIVTENYTISKIISSSRCEEKIISNILQQLDDC